MKLLLGLITLLLMSQSAQACKCRDLSVDEFVDMSSYVAQGVLINQSAASEHYGVVSNFKILSISKGERNIEFIEIHHDQEQPSCGIVFKFHHEYVLYIFYDSKAQVYSTSGCSPTAITGYQSIEKVKP